MRSTLDPVSAKIFMKEEDPSPRKKRAHRYLETKGDNRVKLPILSNTMANFNDSERKRPFNAINEMEQEELSMI
jgi:hypothetical protein